MDILYDQFSEVIYYWEISRMTLQDIVEQFYVATSRNNSDIVARTPFRRQKFIC